MLAGVRKDDEKPFSVGWGEAEKAADGSIMGILEVEALLWGICIGVEGLGVVEEAIEIS